MEEIIIEKIEIPELKSSIIEEVLKDLPEWFGLPESTKQYVLDSKELALWLARNFNETIGFVTLKETSEDTCEVHCMGVKKAHHRKGIGKRLHKSLEDFARGKYDYIQAKTVDEGHYEEYNQTVAFYKSLGFKKLEVFPSLWDEWNPCLILVKKI